MNLALPPPRPPVPSPAPVELVDRQRVELPDGAVVLAPPRIERSGADAGTCGCGASLAGIRRDGDGAVYCPGCHRRHEPPGRRLASGPGGILR